MAPRGARRARRDVGRRSTSCASSPTASTRRCSIDAGLVRGAARVAAGRSPSPVSVDRRRASAATRRRSRPRSTSAAWRRCRTRPSTRPGRPCPCTSRRGGRRHPVHGRRRRPRASGPPPIAGGHGLSNMVDRVGALGGTLARRRVAVGRHPDRRGDPHRTRAVAVSGAAVRAVARHEWARRGRSLLLIGLIAGLLGGLIVAGAGLARRTATAPGRLQEAVAPGDALVDVFGDPAITPTSSPSPASSARGPRSCPSPSSTAQRSPTWGSPPVRRGPTACSSR